MPDFYLVAVALLFLLALLDLSVGVSNDAVNFLNSAIGSRVASRTVILAIASIGIVCGALFSSGMMEVARKGIFNPELFSFADVMVIFLAVMIADVILLDLFNTFGLPTSTTVSIVFELFGASVVVAALVVMSDPGADSVLAFINARQAGIIVGGILLSVVVAFSVGTAIQFLSRLLFGFEGRHGPMVKWSWAALALSAISFFLFVKGLKGAAFVPAGAVEFVFDHLAATALVLFAVWFVLVLGLVSAGIEPLRVVVLTGTFALAMAFASNDLVNFIGVPLAGLSSFQAWQGTGLAPETMAMTALTEPVRGNTGWLLAAGLVMVITLWLSAKARSVTETEVNLGRQDESAERFRPGPVARSVVRAFLAAADFVQRVFPGAVQQQVTRRFSQSTAAPAGDGPAFDLVRASVNLSVAAILIAFATSLKLPLSTTYVSFMVAMGTSLADRAWGRDSAAYRVSGVLSVIGGWFATAAMAFAGAGFIAFVIYEFELSGLIVMVAGVVFALVHSSRVHRRRAGAAADTGMPRLSGVPADDAMARVMERLGVQLDRLAETLDASLTGLHDEDSKALQAGRRHLLALEQATDVAERRMVAELKHSHLVARGAGDLPLRLLDAEQDLRQSAQVIVDSAQTFVLNGHVPPSPATRRLLDSLTKQLTAAVRSVRQAGVSGAPQPGEPLHGARRTADELVAVLLEELQESGRSARNAGLLIRIALECRDVVEALERMQELVARPA